MLIVHRLTADFRRQKNSGAKWLHTKKDLLLESTTVAGESSKSKMQLEKDSTVRNTDKGVDYLPDQNGPLGLNMKVKDKGGN